MSSTSAHHTSQHSDVLHARVQNWILGDAASREPFEAVALEIARFQARCNPGYARLVQARGSRLDSLDAIAPVPTDAFRLSRIAVHAPELDVVRYSTSGTTSSSRGIHALRRTDTYATAAVAGGRAALLQGSREAAVVALLPGMDPQTSSLAAMARMFMDAFEPVAPREGPKSDAPIAWLMDNPDVVAALVAHLDRAKALNVPLLVVATTLALVHLFELLGDRNLRGWPHVIVMPTGGAKGKAQPLEPAQLRARLTDLFGIDTRQVIGEYGMTELASQLYEAHPTNANVEPVPGVYYPPDWLHVCPVDGETLAPVKPGEVGLARFIDLANVDSAICIVTQDLIRAQGDGFELLGRQPGAPSRGCSLSTEEWLGTQEV